MTSTARSDMRLASSWMVIVSGSTISRAIFSRDSCWPCPFRRCVRRRNAATERMRSSSASVALATVRRPRLRGSAPRVGRGVGSMALPEGAGVSTRRGVAGAAATRLAPSSSPAVFPPMGRGAGGVGRGAGVLSGLRRGGRGRRRGALGRLRAKRQGGLRGRRRRRGQFARQAATRLFLGEPLGGEAYSQYDRDRAIAAQVEELGRYVVGRDPFQVRHILQIAFDDYAQRRGSLELFCATSGIEQALWDIVGKAAGQPVYNLLGGPVRSRIRVYANGWSYKMREPQDFVCGAEAVLKRGFTAMKFDPVPGPWRTFIPKEHIRHAVKVMRAMRDAVGPNVDLLLDIHRRLAPMHAIDLANALAEFEPYWFEEPCQCENVEALAEVRRASRIPVVTGEALYTRSVSARCSAPARSISSIRTFPIAAAFWN